MISKYSWFGMAGAALVYVATATAVSAVPITLESVPQSAVDRTTIGGYDVAASQYLGWRFTVDQPFEVTAVGGNFTFSGELFAAVVSLGGSGALPLGNPFLPEDIVAAINFDTSGLHTEILVPFSVSLMPGEYGLVFGSGLFGADGKATLSFLVGDPASDPNYFRWDTSNPPGTAPLWVNGGESARFVVQGLGKPVPDSMPGLVGVLALASLLAYHLKVRWRQAA